MKLRFLIAGLIIAGTAAGQTKLNLSAQSQDVDFTDAASTRPFRSGATLPATCILRETFYLTSAVPGRNVYACSSTNQWMVLGDPLPSASGHAGAVLTSNGSLETWVALGGDVSGTPGAESVQGLLGVPLSSTAPVDGQALVYNAALNRWQPGSGGSVPNWPITRTSDTLLTIGNGPGVRLGSTYCQVPVSSATVTIGGGTGNIYIFIRQDCTLVAANNVLVTACSNCTAVSGTGYQPNSFPLGQWSVTGGVLAAQGMAAVTPYGVQPLLAGQNIQLTYSGGSTQVSAPNLAAFHPTRMIGYTFDVGGTPLAAGLTKYLAVPFACTVTGWDLVIDQGGATVRLWKAAAGSSVPTVANNISTNGLSLSSGTATRSTDVSDFTSTAISTGDILAFNLFAVSAATYVNVILECVQ